MNIFKLSIACLIGITASSQLYAASAAWLANPGSGDFFSAANWSPAAVPGVSGSSANTDIATFATSTIKNIDIALSSQWSIGGFNIADDYIFNLSGVGATRSFRITDTGINITSGSAAVNLDNVSLLIMGACNNVNFTLSSNSNHLQLTAGTSANSGTTIALAGSSTLTFGSFTGTAGPPFTIGSIEGVGASLVATADISVGSNNLNKSLDILLSNGLFNGTRLRFIKTGTGTLVFTGTFDDESVSPFDLYINDGAFQFGDGVITTSTLPPADGLVNNDSLLIFNQPNSYTAEPLIQGTGILRKISSNTLTLTGSNTYSGGTELVDGTVVLGNDTALGTNTVTVSGNATLQSDNDARSIANNFSIDSGQTLTISGTNNLSLSGTIAGNGSLTKDGSNILILSGANTYTGTTTINDGTLRAGADENIISASSLAIADVLGATFDLNDFDQTVNNLSGGGSNGGTIALGTATLTVNQTTNTSYSGDISGAGNFIKAGDATLTLGSADFNGTLTINAGTLVIANALSVSNPSEIILANAVGAALDLSSGAQNINNLSGGGTNGGNLILGSSSIGIFQEIDATYSGVISGSGGFLNKGGSATLTLDGMNTYTGSILIGEGTLRAGDENIIANIPLLSVDGGIFDLNNFDQNVGILAGSGNITLGSATLTINQFIDEPFSNSVVISGSGGFTKAGSGLFTFSTVQNYTGITTINAGILSSGVAHILTNSSAVTLANTAGAAFDLNGFNQTVNDLSGGGTTGGNVTLGAATLTVNSGTNTTYSGVISGSGGLTKAGSAALTLGGANTYGGGTNISAGTVVAGNNTAFGTGAVTITGNSSIQSNDNNRTLGNNWVINSGQTLTLSGANNLTLSGSFSGAGNFVKAGDATLTLGSAGFNGTLTINAGTLVIANALSVSNPSEIILANAVGAALDLSSGTQNINNLSGGGANGGNLILGSSSIGIFQEIDATYSGVISGSGGLTKAGSAALTLGGANTYGGGTNISAGTVVAGNNTAFGTGAITITGNSSIQSNDNNRTLGNNWVINSGQTLTLSGANNLTLSGSFSGAGNLSKNTAMLLTLSNNNISCGNITVSSGELVFSGNAVNAANFNNSATVTSLAPTAFNFSGNTWVNTGTFTFYVNSTSQMTTVTASNAAIDSSGGTIAINYAGGNLDTGVYNLATGNAPALVSSFIQPSYSPSQYDTMLASVSGNNIILTVNRIAPPPPEPINLNSLSPLAREVAEFLNSVNNYGATAAQQELISNLGEVANLEQLNNYLLELVPLLTAPTHAMMIQNQKYQQVTTRVAALRDKKFYASGDGNNEYGFWLRPFYDYAKQFTTSNMVGYNATTIGLIGGIDHEVNPRVTLGLAFSYAHSKVASILNLSTKTDLNDYLGSLYGSYEFKSKTYFDWMLSGGKNYYYSTRIIPTTNEIAYAQYDGSQYAARGIVSREYSYCNLMVTPQINANYVYFHQEQYFESGAGSLGWNVVPDDPSAFTIGAGLQIAAPKYIKSKAFRPEIHALGYYDIKSDVQNATTSFVTGGPTFAVATQTGRFTGQAGASLGVWLGDNFEARLEYDFLLKSNYFDNIVFLNLRYRF